MRYNANVKEAVDFLVKHLPAKKISLDSLALITYILHLTQNRYQDLSNSLPFFNFQRLQTELDESSRFQYKDGEKLPSVDIETAAYCLLTYLQRGLITKALPIMEWMVAQRNSNGGFRSVQVSSQFQLN